MSIVFLAASRITVVASCSTHQVCLTWVHVSGDNFTLKPALRDAVPSGDEVAVLRRMRTHVRVYGYRLPLCTLNKFSPTLTPPLCTINGISQFIFCKSVIHQTNKKLQRASTKYSEGSSTPTTVLRTASQRHETQRATTPQI